MQCTFADAIVYIMIMKTVVNDSVYGDRDLDFVPLRFNPGKKKMISLTV